MADDLNENKSMDEAAYMLNLKQTVSWHDTFQRETMERNRTVSEEMTKAYQRNADFLQTLANMTLANNALLGQLSMIRGQTKESIMFDKITGPETVAMSEMQGFRAAERGGVLNTEILARMVSNMQNMMTVAESVISDALAYMRTQQTETAAK